MKDHTCVYDLKACPAWERWREGGHGEGFQGGAVMWSGVFAEPPEVGARVHVRINGFGPGEVIGYFTEHGYLGICVRPDVRPAWHVKQNGAVRDYCLVFGQEVEPEPMGKVTR